MIDPNNLKQLARLASGSGVKSTVLIDLRWLAGLLIFAFVLISVGHAATWVCVAILILACISVIAYLAAWIIFARKNVDLLRTESFILRQQELQLLSGKEVPQFIDLPSKRVDAPTDSEKPNRDEPASELGEQPESDNG